MLRKVIRYELNQDIKLNKLFEYGFDFNNDNKLVYYKDLYGSIKLRLCIDPEEKILDIDIIDTYFDKTYKPFFEYRKFEFLKNVTKHYHKEMYKFEEEGILIRKDNKIIEYSAFKEKIRQKRLSKKR